MNVSTKPLLRWAGSKRKLLPKISPYWSPSAFDRYIEPFAGSACLFFAVQPKKAVLSDINSDLITTYKAVRDHPRAIWNRLCKFRLGKKAYYEIREIDPAGLSELDLAARFIYLNRFCFNGIYRTNNDGRFNVPFASSGTGQLPDFETLSGISRSLGKATLVSRDFESLLKTHVKKGDFVYLDPPYAVENRRIFRQYGATTFGVDDLDRLQQALKSIDQKGAKFVVSYAYSAESKELMRGWNVRKVMTQRNVSGFSRHRRKAAELLATNIEELAIV